MLRTRRLMPISSARRWLSTGSTPPPSTGSQEATQTRVLAQLRVAGFSEDQGRAIVDTIRETLGDSAHAVSQSLVHPSELVKIKSDSSNAVDKLRMDIRNLSILDYGQLRVELKRIQTEVDSLRDTVNNNVLNTHGGVQLDINLEKKRVAAEVNALEHIVTNAEAKIEKEIGLLVSKIEKMRTDMKQGFLNFLGVAGVLFFSFNTYTYFHHGKGKRHEAKVE
ncbi:hypothetical protein BC830DRAFT_1109198 [Chytriomyces sp. MP71]|nr:hypothetical protein BC830DRAFT_1109198 [Chytriomyces sp. MP71]